MTKRYTREDHLADLLRDLLDAMGTILRQSQKRHPTQTIADLAALRATYERSFASVDE
jgi:ornithine carbamoyltransferase